jgi:hypothetical protein
MIRFYPAILCRLGPGYSDFEGRRIKSEKPRISKGSAEVVRAVGESLRAIAFSSEVEPVRVKKTRQNKESKAPFRFNRNGKGSSVDTCREK